ncbi:MAG: sugar transferase, partial [Gemmatimonadota bacterium]
AALLLVVLAPQLLAAALAVRLTSRGPVLYAQPRWGRGERLFTCYKFRSMVAEPDAALTREVARRQTGGGLAKGARDPRVTRVGALLRRTSIDELPQLWNVLRGDMSLVGPRPLMVHMLEPYPDFRALRCTVRPGITGLWQVRDRARNDHVRYMAAHDAEYILGFSFWLDLRILLATVRVVLSGDGAV